MSGPGPGHVFIAHGDLLSLACDEMLVPTDAALDVPPRWRRWRPSRSDRQPLLDSMGDRRVSDSVSMGAGKERIRYVDVGATPQTVRAEWLLDGIREALDAVGAELADQQRTPLRGRERFLVAMPPFGVGSSGFDGARGEALTGMLAVAQEAVAQHGFDVVICCLRRADYTALQSRRGTATWAGMRADLLSEADRLGKLVRVGEVVWFLGAGVSAAAGLPNWADLLTAIARDNGHRDFEQFRWLAENDGPAAAWELRYELGDAFDEGLRQQFSGALCGMSHLLLASMRVEEAITTNIDGLYEQAAATAFSRELVVLPWHRRPGRGPWLLKLHGDLELGGAVFTDAEYGDLEQEGVAASIVQSLMMTRHLVFVGYSLRDSTFIGPAMRLAEALRKRNAKHKEVGTVLTMSGEEPSSAERGRGIRTVKVGRQPTFDPAAPRQLELLLDRMAWQACSSETAWLLDPRYSRILDDADRALVAALGELQIPGGDRWAALRQVLREYGASIDREA
jgi:plasmid stabilization system protein ParE